jgi:hypothetical protein
MREQETLEQLQQVPGAPPEFLQMAQQGFLQPLHAMGVPRNIVAQQLHFVFEAIYCLLSLSFDEDKKLDRIFLFKGTGALV